MDSSFIPEYIESGFSMKYFVGSITQQYVGDSFSSNAGSIASPDAEFENDDLSQCPPSLISIGGGGGVSDGSIDTGGPGDVDISGDGTVCYYKFEVVGCAYQQSLNIDDPEPHGSETCGPGTGTTWAFSYRCYDTASMGINDGDSCTPPSGDVGVLPINLLELTLEEQNFWREKIQKAIAEGLTSVAEIAHELYVYADALVKASPLFTEKANNLISFVKTVVEEFTDQNRSTMGWPDLVSIWLFEIGNYTDDTINFVDGDATVDDLKLQEGVNEAMDIAMSEVLLNDFNPVIHTWVYGQDQFYVGVTESSYATSFLGTYTVEVIKIDQGTSVLLKFKVKNKAHWESGTRLRKDGNGNHIGIIPSKARGKGIKLGGNLFQTYTWSRLVITG